MFKKIILSFALNSLPTIIEPILQKLKEQLFELKPHTQLYKVLNSHAFEVAIEEFHETWRIWKGKRK